MTFRTINKKHSCASAMPAQFIHLLIIAALVALPVLCTAKAHAADIKGEVPLCAVKIESIENMQRGLLIKWAKTSGACGYRVFRKDDSEDNSEWKCVRNAQSKSLVAWKNISVRNGRKYRYVVIAYKKKSGAVTQKSPRKSDEAAAVSVYRMERVPVTSINRNALRKATVRWNASSSADGYIVQFSKTPLFLSYESFTVKGRGNVSLTSYLKSSYPKCYARVRSYKNNGKASNCSCWAYSPNMKKRVSMKIVLNRRKGKILDYRKLARQKMSGYDTFQGASSAGAYSYHYLVKKRKKQKARLIRVRIATGKVVAVGAPNTKGHANSLTYCPDDRILVSTHGRGKANYVNIISPAKLKKTGTRKIKVPKKICSADEKTIRKIKGFTAICYNSTRKKYVARIKDSSAFLILDRNFTAERYIGTNVKNKQMNQSAICTNDLIVNLKSREKKKQYNIAIVFDWEGNHITTIRLGKKYELEDMYEYGGRLYGQFYHSFNKVIKKKKTVRVKRHGKKRKKKIRVKKKVFVRENYIFRAI